MRPDWDNYFLGLAFIISARSRDVHTQHGAIITDGKNRIIGTGYNSFIEGANDTDFPTTRPEKYAFMIHSEENAILNCTVPPRSCAYPTLYVTGQPCNNCFQRIIQSGIKRIVAAKRKGTQLENEESKRIFDLLRKNSEIVIDYLDIDLNWITKHMAKF
jgi:dCMP deaminase